MKNFKRTVAAAASVALVLTSAYIGIRSFADAAPVPIALYSFEDPGNFGKDSSGNHPLESFGALVQSDEGAAGKGAYFDGASYLESESVNDFTDSLTDYTISFFAKRDSSASGEMITVGTGWRESTPGIHVNLNDGYFCAGLRSDRSSPSWLWYQTDVKSAMHHYAVVVSGDGSRATLYMDGSIVKTEEPGSGKFTMNNSANPFSIGALTNGSGWYGYAFKGVLDEVAVYDKSLSASEITAISKPQGGGGDVTEGKLIARYSFDDEAAPGTDSNGMYSLNNKGGVTVSDDSFSGKSAYFAGKSPADSLSRSGSDFSDTFNDFTFTCYAKPDGTQTDNACFVSTGWDPTGGVSLGLTASGYVFLDSASADKSAVWAAEKPAGGTDGFHFYALAVSENGKKIEVYFDGSLLMSKTLSSPVNMITGHDFVLGQCAWYGGYYFKGYLDEVGIYNYGMSGSEIAKLYNPSSSEKKRLAYYSFEDGSNLGADTENRFNLENKGTVSQSDAGFSGKGAYFSGQTETDSLFCSGSNFSDSLTDFTIACYAKADGEPTGNSCFISTGWDPTGGLSLGIQPNGYLLFDSAMTGGQSVWEAPNAGVSFSSSYHFYAVTVSNQGKKLDIYFDGDPVASKTLSKPINMNSGHDFVLGQCAWYGGYYFKGYLDEVSVYNYGLTADEIYKLCKIVKEGELVLPENSEIARYSFNDAVSLGKDSLGLIELTNKGNVRREGNGTDGFSAYFDGSVLEDCLFYDGKDFSDRLTDFSASFYAKANKSPSEPTCLFSTGWDPAGGVSFGMTSGGFLFLDAVTEAGTVVWESANAGCSFTKDYHLYTLSVSGGGKVINIYVDEELLLTKTLSAPLKMNNTSCGFVIGQNAWYGGYRFNGWMDEVRLYNYGVSAEMVSEIYKAVGGKSNEVVIPANSLMAKYLFEDSTNLGKDSLGHFDLTNQGGVKQINNGYSGAAASFAGVESNECLFYEGKDFTDNLTEITVNFYARTSNPVLSDNACILSTGWDTTGGLSLGFCGDNSMFLDTRTKSSEVVWLASKTGVSGSDDFHGYTFSVTDGGRTVSYYVDGKYIAGRSVSEPIDMKGSFGVVIGSVCWFGGYLFSGALDELAIYNYGMSADAVAAMYSSGEAFDKNLVSYYSFDQAGAIGRDSVSSNHLANKGCVSYYPEGYKGAAAYFAGIDWKDALQLEGDDFMRKLSEFTVNFYARVDDDVADNACVISTGWDGGKGISIGLRPKNSFFIDSETSGKTTVWESFKTKIAANEAFHAYTVTYSSAVPELVSYVDGVKVSTVKLDSPLQLDSSFKFTVGQVAWSGYMFRGWIDELSIYKTAMNEQQVARLTGLTAGSENGTGGGIEAAVDTPAAENKDTVFEDEPEKKIESAKIPDQTVKPSESRKSGMSATVIAVICTVTVIIAGGAVLLIIYFGKRKKSRVHKS